MKKMKKMKKIVWIAIISILVSTMVVISFPTVGNMIGKEVVMATTVVTYVDTVPTLPQSIVLTTNEEKSIEKSVIWENVEADMFTVPYERVIVTGTVTGTSYIVSIPIEVIPHGLLYYIDCGTDNGTSSDSHSAVVNSGLCPQLVNTETGNQMYSSEALWGRSTGFVSYNSNSNDKLLSGAGGNGRYRTYTVTLDAGCYDLTVAGAYYENAQGHRCDGVIISSTTNGVLIEDEKLAVDSGDMITGMLKVTEDNTRVVLTMEGNNNTCPGITFLAISVHDEVATKKLVLLTMPFRLAGETEGDNIKLNWNIVENATIYRLSKKESDSDNYHELTTAKGLIWDDYDLGESEKVFYKIEALDDEGNVIEWDTAYGATYDNLNSYNFNTRDNTISDGIEGIRKGFRSNEDLNGDGMNEFVSYSFVLENDVMCIYEKISYDGGFTFSESRKLNIEAASEKYDINDLTHCKFESMNAHMNPNGEIVFWAHYEIIGKGYTTARVVCIAGTPFSDTFLFYGSYRPQGMDSRDMGAFVDSFNNMYLIVATSGNSDLSILKLNETWTEILPATEWPAITVCDNLRREAPNMMEYNGWFYLFSSGTAGWYPTQGAYISARTIEGLADAQMHVIGNTGGFGVQSNYTMELGGFYSMNGFRWSGGWTYPDPAMNGAWSTTRMLPMALDEGKAAYNWFASIDYIIDYQSNRMLMVPVQSGKILSIDAEIAEEYTTIGLEGMDASMANDGIEVLGNNRYNPNTIDGTYIWTVDLGALYAINEVNISFRLVGGSETMSRYKIRGSKTGENFITLKDKTDNVITGFNENLIETDDVYRYVQIQVFEVLRASNASSLNADWTRGFNEVMIYGESAKSQ